MITDDELRQIMPDLQPAKRALYLPFLQSAMAEFDITNYLREAAFLAQLAHESAQFRFMEEIWGPTPAQRRYEGRRDLGNTQPGDGFRFKGRGPIQITGRANYTRYGSLLGINLVDGDHPQRAAQPEVAFRIAGLFWKSNGLNELADQEKFITITRRINGGTNGLADRQMFYARAKRFLSQQDGATRGPRAANSGRLESGGESINIPRNLARGIYPGKEEAAAAKQSASTKGSAQPSAVKRGGAKRAPAKKRAGATKRQASRKGALKKRSASNRG